MLTKVISVKERVVDIITLSLSFTGLVYSMSFFLPVVVAERGIPIWVVVGTCLSAIACGLSIARIINYARG